VSLLLPIYSEQNAVETSNQKLPTGANKKNFPQKTYSPLLKDPEKSKVQQKTFFFFFLVELVFEFRALCL
jgi:hypothetical protein